MKISAVHGRVEGDPHRWFGDPIPGKRCIVCGADWTDLADDPQWHLVERGR